MSLTIEIDDRDWDVEQITAALMIPAARQYVAELTIDEPSHGQIVFYGDVRLDHIAVGEDVLVVSEWNDPELEVPGAEHRFNVADIRRISFY